MHFGREESAMLSFGKPIDASSTSSTFSAGDSLRMEIGSAGGSDEQPPKSNIDNAASVRNKENRMVSFRETSWMRPVFQRRQIRRPRPANYIVSDLLPESRADS